jgi:hypothetical protein
MDFAYFYPVKHMFFLIIILSSYLGLFSQENPNSISIQTSIKMKVLQEKKSEFHKLTNGEVDGYRVKIHFSSDRTKAKEVKTDFEAKYPSISSYEDYQQPNFVIMVGDFKSKLEAYETLKKIKTDYPYAFIVKSKIKPLKLG